MPKILCALSADGRAEYENGMNWTTSCPSPRVEQMQIKTSKAYAMNAMRLKRPSKSNGFLKAPILFESHRGESDF